MGQQHVQHHMQHGIALPVGDVEEQQHPMESADGTLGKGVAGESLELCCWTEQRMYG